MNHKMNHDATTNFIEQKSKDLQGIIDGFDQSVLVINKNFLIQRVNRSALLSVRARTFQEVLGKKCHKVFFGIDNICDFCGLKNGKKIEAFFDRHNQKNREVKNKGKGHSVNKTLIFNHKQYAVEHLENDPWLVEIFTDITEIKSKEAEQKRDDILINLGTVIQTVAHELANPLAGMRLTIESLELLNIKDSKIQKKVELLSKDIDLATCIVEEIRFAIAPQNYSLVPENLLTLITNAIKQANRIFNHNIKILLDFQIEKESMILANENKVIQVFFNLIKNSIEAYTQIENPTPSNERELIIKVYYPENDKNDSKYHQIIEVQFIDNVGGIPKTVLERIFDPFYTTKRLKKSSGLGLFIVRKILKEHSAIIEVESKKEQTVFYIQFSRHLVA